jgi:sugar lactone lactonase YvrE
MKLKPRHALIFFGIAVCALVLTHVMSIIIGVGYFTQIQNRSLYNCRASSPIPGPEDAVVIPGMNKLVVSSDARDGNWEKSGDLFIYDLESGALVPQKVVLGDNGSFHPHGIDIIKIAQTLRLFVVNHRTSELTTIELFDIGPNGSLIFFKSIQDPLFKNGNDIAGVGFDRFYLTSDFGNAEGWRRKAEQYLRIGSGYLSFYDGNSARVVRKNLFFANGIALDETGENLFVVEMLGQKLHIYGANPATGELIDKKTLTLGFSPDNITIKGEAVLFGVHPKILALKDMSLNREARSPSRVMQLDDWTNDSPSFQELMMDDGSQIAASSVALRLSKDRVFIGSVFDGHFVDCRLK